MHLSGLLPPSIPAWYALHTKPRQEQRAVENLAAWGVEALAPQLRLKSNSSFPQFLFPGYIFARFDASRMLRKVRFTRGVWYVVCFGEEPAPIAEEVITELRSRLDERGFVRKADPLRRGDLVMIESGPLKDFMGVFEDDLPQSERVRILLKTVGYSAHVDISRFAVKKLAVNNLTDGQAA